MWFELRWMHLCINESSVDFSITKEYLQIIEMEGGFDSYLEFSSSFIAKQPYLQYHLKISEPSNVFQTSCQVVFVLF